jgi:hypothetical protein
MPKKNAKPREPRCFVSYSTREPEVKVLIDCLRIVFARNFRIDLTPSAFESGGSQLQQVSDLIEKCAFAVVVLDGLRPNVVFEYGIIHGKNKPTILLKEEHASVDIRGLHNLAGDLNVVPVKIDVDKQFSDVKDLNYAIWKRFSIKETVKIIWDEYCKKKGKMEAYIEIQEPKLW